MIAKDPRYSTTVYLWNQMTDDDLVDSALAVRLSSREKALIAAIDQAILVLTESSSGPAVEAESILRAAKRGLE